MDAIRHVYLSEAKEVSVPTLEGSTTVTSNSGDTAGVVGRILMPPAQKGSVSDNVSETVETLEPMENVIERLVKAPDPLNNFFKMQTTGGGISVQTINSGVKVFCYDNGGETIFEVNVSQDGRFSYPSLALQAEQIEKILRRVDSSISAQKKTQAFQATEKSDEKAKEILKIF